MLFRSLPSPTIVLRDGKPAWALGLPGGVRIFTSVFQALVNLIDHRMSLQEAVEAPRIWSQGQELEVEQDVPAAVRDALASRGHQIVAVGGVGRDERGAAQPRRHAGGRGVLARRRHADRGERRARPAGEPLPAGREPARYVVATEPFAPAVARSIRSFAPAWIHGKKLVMMQRTPRRV